MRSAIINLEEVFSFGTSFGEWSRAALAELAMKLDAGWISAERITLPQTLKYSVAQIERFSGRTPQHQLLCAEAASFFERKGWIWSAAPRDLDYAGGCADVAAVVERTYAECGYTNSMKVLRAAKAQQAVFVVPYTDDELSVGYMFSATSTYNTDYDREVAEADRKAIRGE